MSIRCGFFNSIDKDRLYSAEDMNEPYKGILSDGVLVPNADMSNEDKLKNNALKVTSAGQGMNVKVGSGRGIFNHKWFLNDSDIIFTIESNNTINPRYDSVIVQIDNTVGVRAANILVRTGEPNSSPVPPALSTDENVIEYRLANIYVASTATNINNDAITDMRGLPAQGGTGWVVGLVQQLDTTELFTQWQNGFDTWFNDVKDTLASSTLIRSYTSYYITSLQDEVDIPIQIPQFNQNLDILQVYINGLMLIKNLEYTIIDNTKIKLSYPVDINNPVSFVVYKSIDGTDAETVVSQVNDLQNLVNLTMATSNTGSTKLSVFSGEDALLKFVNAGKGLHSMYIQSGALNVPATGAFRALGHLTGETAGWLMVFQANGSAYINYMNESAWVGWRVLHEAVPTPLYISTNGVYPNDGVEIVPSKQLNLCQHGWQLIFTGYDESNKVARDYYTQIINIPKRSYKNANWNGESMTMTMAYAVNSSTGAISNCAKVFTIYNDKLVSGETNSNGISRNLVLRAIYEY